MMNINGVLALSGLVTMVSAHGFVISPPARMPGAAMKAACGNQVEIQQISDNYGNIQGMLQVANGQSDFNAASCDVWLCKGYKFDDNTANVQSFSAGEVVPIQVDIRAPHTGTANVSIVDTATNSIIGQPLITFSDYASTATGVKDSDKNFEITIPSDLGSQCNTAGACVIQWWWDARSIDQTYESCIDFTLSGSGSGSSPVSSSAAVPSATTAPSVTVPASSASASATSTSPVVSPVASATATPTGITRPSKDLPEGTTIEDIISWLTQLFAQAEAN